MKTELLKKFFAFIVTMMFSISFLQAQCNGNKVLLHRGTRGCHQRCVALSQVAKYASEGWVPGPCSTIYFFAQSNNKISNKKISTNPLAKSPADSDIALKKVGRR